MMVENYFCHIYSSAIGITGCLSYFFDKPMKWLFQERRPSKNQSK